MIYLVRVCELHRATHGEVCVREVTCHVQAESETDAMRAVLVRGDNGAHLPRGSSVLRVMEELAPARVLEVGDRVLGVVGVEEREEAGQ